MPLYEITTTEPDDNEEFRKELRAVLADCSQFLASDGASAEAKESQMLADRCEAMLSQVAAYEPAAKRLVEADSTAQAIRHCAQGMFAARTIGKPAEVAQLMAGGTTLEKAKGE